MSSRKLRTPLLLAVAVQLLLLGAQLLLEVRLLGTAMARDGGLAAVVAGVLGVAVFPVVGIVILRRRPEHPIGWLFCVATLGFAVANSTAAYVRLASVAGDALPAVELTAWVYSWSGRLSVAGFVLLLLLFPDGRFPSTRWRRVGQAAVALIAATALAAALAPGPVDRMMGVPIDNPHGIGGPVGAVLRLLAEVGWPISLGLMVAAAACLLQRYRRSRGVERAQLKWFVAGVVFWALWLPGFVVAVLLHVEADAWPLWAQVAAFGALLGGAVIPVSAAIAILRYRLYDIDRIVSRTVGYALVSGVLAAVYLAVVLLASSLIAPLSTDNDLAVAAATLAAAAVFRPARRAIQARVDRRFDRARYDAEQIVQTMRTRLQGDSRLDDVTRELLEAARQAMSPALAGVWLHPARPPREGARP